jgi:hypothetical protein
MEPDALLFNGLNGATGEYLLPPLTPQLISAVARGEKLDPTHIEELKQWWERISQPHYAPMERIDAKNLAESGWAVIFAADADPAIREALSPLLEQRGKLAMAARSLKACWANSSIFGVRVLLVDVQVAERLGQGLHRFQRAVTLVRLVGRKEKIGRRERGGLRRDQEERRQGCGPGPASARQVNVLGVVRLLGVPDQE